MPKRDEFIRFAQEFSVGPEGMNERLSFLETSPLTQKVKLKDLISRPQIRFESIMDIVPELTEFVSGFGDLKDEIIEAAEILMKYSGYIERERLIADKVMRLDNVRISDEFDYKSLNSLSTEARQKLSRIKPATIGQASRISGISPADINVLLVKLGR